MPLAALTALQALRDELGVKPGQKAFISAVPAALARSRSDRQMAGRPCDDDRFERGEALVRCSGLMR